MPESAAIPNWHQVILAAADGVVVTDQLARVTYVNPAFEHMSGFSRAEWVGRRFEVVAAEGQHAIVLTGREPPARAQGPKLVKGTLERKDGKDWVIQASVAPIRPKGKGQADGLVWIVRDVTPYHRSEQQLMDRLVASEAFQEATLILSALLAEYQTPGVTDHVWRMQSYTALLLGALRTSGPPEYRLERDELKCVIGAAALHDVGCVGMPDGVRLKAGPLAFEDEAILRLHPVVGAGVFKRWQDFLVQRTDAPHRFCTVACEVALYHHERWDGKGYPSGLSGAEIPLAARVVALADVYDTLTAPQVHQRPWPHARAVRYIERQAGAAFDPTIVDAFRQVQDQFQWVARNLATRPGAAGTAGSRPGHCTVADLTSVSTLEDGS